MLRTGLQSPVFAVIIPQGSLCLLQVLRYPQLPRSSSALAVWCSQPSRAGDATWDGRLRWQGGELVFNFGRHQNTPLRVVLAERKVSS